MERQMLLRSTLNPSSTTATNSFLYLPGANHQDHQGPGGRRFSAIQVNDTVAAVFRRERKEVCAQKQEAEEESLTQSWSTSASANSSSVVEHTTRSFRVSELAAEINMAAMTNGDVKSRRQLQAAEGPATVMAIGTAVPPFVHEQSTYADYYFDVTNCNHKTELKAKFKRICESQDDNIHRLHI